MLEGELVDLIDDFSDGRIQFAFLKVRDPNTTLPKNVLIAWCGEGVPERTKGYFTSHLAAVSKTLHVSGGHFTRLPMVLVLIYERATTFKSQPVQIAISLLNL